MAPQGGSAARILGVGVAVRDTILTVDGYPPEDSKSRALARRVACGGNAANTLVVLAALGHRPSLAASLAADEAGRALREALEACGVDTAACRIHQDARTPESFILHNRRNGSRTIVHDRDLPEYGVDDFLRLAPGHEDWIHFEGRDAQATREMMQRARARGARVSLEIERPRPGIEAAIPLADVAFFGRDYVVATGATGPETFLREAGAGLPGVTLVCAWGEDGAWTMGADGEIAHSPAWRPERVVDTLGAGDTFNAGVIDALLRGATPAGAIAAACRLAGEKCGAEGLPQRRKV